MKKSAGFTLVEIMVVIGITVLLSGFALSYNRSGRRQVSLYRDESVVVGTLQRAKSLAAERFNKEISGRRNCTFGLHFDPGSKNFFLFQDMVPASSNPVADCNQANGVNYHYDASSVPSEKLESYTLDPQIDFSNIPVGGLDIVFVPPDLAVISNQTLPVTISLQTSDGSISADIIVSRAGLLSSQ